VALREVARLGRLTRAASQLALLRAGLASGAFAALAEPRTADELAEALGAPPDLCAALLRAAHASGFAVRQGARYRRSRLLVWLADSEDGDAARAMLDQAALAYAPALDGVPALLRGAPRRRYGGDEEAARTARASRLLERRALAALHRVPGVRTARRIIDVGCGEGAFLTALLTRYRDALGFGVEREPAVAERARRRLAAAQVHRRAEIWVGDVLASDLPAGAFDLALLNQVLHYCTEAERDALFARLFDRIAPGGLLAIQTPVLQDDALSRWTGLAATAALFDLFLHCHANLSGLPDTTDLQVRLRAAGFAQVGSVSIVPGGSLRYVWARRR
jgi:demethylspheroidene O-methyltransferase